MFKFKRESKSQKNVTPETKEQTIIARYELLYDLSMLGVNNPFFKKVLDGQDPLAIPITDLDPSIYAVADKIDILKSDYYLDKRSHSIVRLWAETTYIVHDDNLFSEEDVALYKSPLEFINLALPKIDPNFAELSIGTSCTKVSWFI